MEKRIGRKRRVSRIKKALVERRQTGQRISGKVPYGWSLATDGKTLIPNDAEQLVLFEISLDVATLHSYREIARKLDELAMKPRSGGQWSASTVRSVHQTGNKYWRLLSPEQFDAFQTRFQERRRARHPVPPLPPIPKPPGPGEEPSDEWMDWLCECQEEHKRSLKEFKLP
jgi:hypothetical protein